MPELYQVYRLNRIDIVYAHFYIDNTFIHITYISYIILLLSQTLVYIIEIHFIREC